MAQHFPKTLRLLYRREGLDHIRWPLAGSTSKAVKSQWKTLVALDIAAHAVWEEFVPDADEPTITARAIRAKKGCPNTIEVDDRRITLSMVNRALAECNRLNLEMGEFTRLLGLSKPPPENVLHL